MKYNFTLSIFFVILGVFFSNAMFGQEEIRDTVQDPKYIYIDRADEAEFIRDGDEEIRYLIGDILMHQDTVKLFCDTAIILNGVDVKAIGNVIIQQGDSITVFADSLLYNGETKIADLFGDVILDSDAQQLRTTQLQYDLNRKVASYYNGASLYNDQSQLSSKRGYFHVANNMAYFKDSVRIIDTSFYLKADTLQFNTQSKIATFLGPTVIVQDESKMYCEAGFYDLENERAEFLQNAQFSKEDQKTTADRIRYVGKEQRYYLEGNAYVKDSDKEGRAASMIYDEGTKETYLKGNAYLLEGEKEVRGEEITYNENTKKYILKGRSRLVDPPQILEAEIIDFDDSSGLGIATGAVIWKDTSSQLEINCEHAYYNREEDLLIASGGRPLLIKVMKDDSLFLRADTIKSMRQTESDTVSNLYAHSNVRIYKSNLQSICDSLIYNSEDSLFTFYKNPIIWSDTSQFLADTISILLQENEIENIFLKQNSLIVNTPDEVMFNQIKGKSITAHFVEGEINEMEVVGNAEALYYVLDEEDAYTGVNKSLCSSMLVLFGSNEVEHIKFYKKPQAKMYPMDKADHKELALDGFRWVIDNRPKNKLDL